jgi:hypothetical protein
MESLGILLHTANCIAGKLSDGHLTIFKFTTNWVVVVY